MSSICLRCQGAYRETEDLVCMSCGRDYLRDDPVPGLGWKRLKETWEAHARELERRLAEIEKNN